MRLSIKALAMASALLWGGAIFLVGLINLASPSYGDTFLRCLSEIYPGFRNAHTLLDVMVGTAYGIIDGAVAGAMIAWLYNLFAKEKGMDGQ